MIKTLWKFLNGADRYLAHKRELGALTLIGVSSPTYRGVNTAETGINCSRFSLEVEPEVNDWLPGITGEAIGKAVSTIPMGRLTIEGEITGSTGVMAAVFGTAFVPANSVTRFGRSAGGFYMNRATTDIDRDGWNRVSCEFESRPLVA
jgi:hypothetical protein